MDGKANKTIYSPVHSIHLADIKTLEVIGHVPA